MLLRAAVVWPSILCWLCANTALQAEPQVTQHWTLDSIDDPQLVLRGDAASVTGVDGGAQSLDGVSLVEVKNFPNVAGTATDTDGPGFALTLWVNPYTPLSGQQQMLVGKNVYARDQREWGAMIDQDGRFRLYLWQTGWKRITAPNKPQPGHWYLVGVNVRADAAELWINGKLAGTAELSQPLPQTSAPLTLGGIDDAGNIRQTFFGALDDVQYFDRPLSSEELAGLSLKFTADPIKGARAAATLPVPVTSAEFPLWDESVELPAATELSELADVEFHVIKKWNKRADGYTFLHGVNLAMHEGKLYASFGHNLGAENTVSEEAQYRVSADGGRSWGPLQVIDAGDEEHLAVSHGVFLSHQGNLWAFHGAYYHKMENIHTRAYRLDAATGTWEPLGVVIQHGFWPMNQPVKMRNGNWIMPGGAFGPYSNTGRFPAAVAISHGDDLTKWDFIEIPVAPSIRQMWGESALIVDGATVINIARYGAAAVALAAVSKDYGRTWNAMNVSNLPMATSKPAAGVLQNGQRYLVCTTASDNGGRRSPLTIAVSQPVDTLVHGERANQHNPGENTFSKVFVIRRSRHEGPGESADQLSLAYPCALEHDGKLYVGFSNNGGRGGNQNSAELAIIPLTSLAN